MSNLTADIQASILKAKNYVDALTINSSCNIPKEVVADEHKFFSWDNEKRTPSVKPYLFDWKVSMIHMRQDQRKVQNTSAMY